nr:MFS transporter [Bifidobacterium saguini]
MADKETVDKASGMKHYAGLAVFSSAVGHALDGLDLMILGFAMSGIMASFNIDKTTASTLTTITLAGAFLGGLVFGRLADKYGRIRVLTYSVIFFGVFTLFSAFAPNFFLMALFRFLAGVGIGAEFGIGMAIAAEASSPENRAKATSGVGLGFQVGVLLASLLSAPILTAFGWRGLFAIGIVPAIVAIFIRVFVPEPPLYLKHRQTAKEHGSIRQLFSTPERVRFSIAIIILCTVQNCGYFGIMTWLPSYLNTELNLSLTSTGIWTAVTVLGMMLGISVFGFLADHLAVARHSGSSRSALHHGRHLQPAQGPDRTAGRWFLHGHVRQRYDRRLWRVDFRAVPDRAACHRTNRPVQHWSFHWWRSRPGRYRSHRHRPRLRFRSGNYRIHLHHCIHHDVLHSREEGRRTRVSGARNF